MPTRSPGADTAADNLAWAGHLVDALAAAGVTRAVISPGSRSTPLALAWLRHPGARTWVQVDERAAAFFALGLARGSGAPVALLATSGSAPAHWLPAVIEASQSATPLVLISADRPAELQDCGANQTVDQVKLFGSHARAFHQTGEASRAPERLRQLRWLAARAADEARHPLPGPVHINVPLREPLLPAGELPALPHDATPAVRVSHCPPAPRPQAITELAHELAGNPGLIVCGPMAADATFAAAVTDLAAQLGTAVLADPLSNLRFGPHDRRRVLTRYDAFLRHGFVYEGTLRWVLRFGAAPTSKPLLQLLERLDVAQTLVTGDGRWRDPVHRATRVLHADAAQTCHALSLAVDRRFEADLLPPLRALEQHAEAAAKALAGVEPLFEAQVIGALVERLPGGARVYAGNSMVIRDLDSFSGSGAQAIEMLGSRGASGIDGNVSTALGIAAAADRPFAALLGDLALFHDLNGLHAARDADALLVVLNNGGGGIFGYLPQSALPEFERGWLTPVGLDIGQAARLFGVEHRRAVTAAELTRALDELMPARGARLLEAVIDREASLAHHRVYWEAPR
ncbi:MAG TPA: 2-succinyl-5-enolpyruvyl-6-hydroxy-3-cyclohexene-1-carboxylic-acid synthase [Pelomicrobium sp.]|nr:2-succinyl-5-enolpyruvyl-6-hydroxy-3-cyclohexene-1-carboxylic-acid synthase [Pelomicrobium sp.]